MKEASSVGEGTLGRQETASPVQENIDLESVSNFMPRRLGRTHVLIFLHLV